MRKGTAPHEPLQWRKVLGDLFTVNEDATWRWRPGLEAALATALPLGILTAAGYQSLGLIASLGTFTALFAPELPRLERFRTLLLIGAGMIGASLIGVLFAASAWLTVVGVMVVASLACLLILGYKVGPPGPIHFILVNGVSGHLASPAHLGGSGMPGHLVLLMVALGVLSSLFVVMAPWLLPSVRRREGRPRPLGEVYGYLEFDRMSRWVALRVVGAVLVASLVSLPLGIPRGYWVVLTCVAILQASHRVPLTIVRTVQRFVGTLVGVLIFVLLARLAPAGGWLVLLVASLEFMIELVVAKNYGLALLFITPLALTISSANVAASPLGIAGERVLDTLLGAVIALLVLFAVEWLRRRMTRAP